MKTLIIDNYDSMTFNLFQYLGEVNGEEPIVVRNDAARWQGIETRDFDNIVISPGPGRPEREADFGISRDAVLKARVPVLGVCLGHQGIAYLFGGRIRHAPEPMHGRCSLIYHTGEDLFQGLPSPCSVVRYHSLMIHPELPADLEVQALTRDGVIMGLRSRSRPVWGVQFHPESIGTEHGKQLLANFRRLTETYQTRRRTTANGTGHRFNQVPAFRTEDSAAGKPCHYRLHARRLDFTVDAEALFINEFGRSDNAFWLDSSLVTAGLSRFSFMGDASGPHAEVVTYRSRERTLKIERGDIAKTHHESLFAYLRRELTRRRLDSDAELPFDLIGGYVGYFGYELKQECGATPGHHSSTPDAALIFADRLVAFDHQENRLWLICLAQLGEEAQAKTWLDRMEACLRSPPARPPLCYGAHQGPVAFKLRHDHDAYLARIRACLEEIRNGESYEICLTNQIRTVTQVEPLKLYRVLRSLNPAPYSAFLRFSAVQVMCSSPERFLKIDRLGMIEAKPIKGTIARAASPAKDDALREQLHNSEKDRAENLMIVDLLRNDLGLVCELHSVTVPKLMAIESYATVHQMVSTIRGRLHPSLSPVDAVRAAFPGGSMSGAPKLRTLEIIDRLEQGPRGVYSGAVGFLGLNSTVDLNIVIRTVVADPDGLYIGCGGAITYLSDPTGEFDEMMLKAWAPMRAIALAASGDQGNYRVEGASTETLFSEPAS